MCTLFMVRIINAMAHMWRQRTALWSWFSSPLQWVSGTELETHLHGKCFTHWVFSLTQDYKYTWNWIKCFIIIIFIIIILLLLLFCGMDIYPECLTVHHEDRECIGSPKTGVKNGDEPPDRCLKLNPGSLKGQPVLLTAESSLQSLNVFLYYVIAMSFWRLGRILTIWLQGSWFQFPFSNSWYCLRSLWHLLGRDSW